MEAEANVVPELTQPLTMLYVDEFEENVTKEELRLLFDRVGGDVVSIEISIDEVLRRPCAYVNFSNPQHAEKALELLNFAELKGRCIRIAYWVGDDIFCNSSNRNLFIKNLDKKINHKALYKLFSPFGKILSCKVATDSSGISNGYGYVLYFDEESAVRAIKDMHNSSLYEKKVYVLPYLSKKERENKKLTNVFVKNISESTVSNMASVALQPSTMMVQPLRVPISRPFPIHSNYDLPFFYHNPYMQFGVGPPSNVMFPIYPPPLRIMRQQHHPIPTRAFTSALFDSSPAQRRMMVGYNLFPLIKWMRPERAAKVTDKFLELDQNEILYLMESSESLKIKVAEILKTLSDKPHL